MLKVVHNKFLFLAAVVLWSGLFQVTVGKEGGQRNIEFTLLIERFGGFIRDRSAIEVEYALKLR